MILLSFCVLAFSWRAANGLDFAPYKPSEQYKCGAFLKGRVEDQALGYYYAGIRQFVAYLSQPFPHDELLSDDALRGDLNEWRQSFENKYNQWLTWEQWWLGVSGGLLVVSILFPILYILYRICSCCCGSDSKKHSTDGEYDGCKRNLLNMFLVIFILIDVFAASTLLVTGQYAEYGLEELPNRMNHCVDDLNLYKRETDTKFRKLLIDDFREFNQSMIEQMNRSGHYVVDRIKKVTGAHAIDIFMNITSGAAEVRDVLTEVKEQMKNIDEEANKFYVEFKRMRAFVENELKECVEGKEGEREAMRAHCSKSLRLLDDIGNAKFSLDRDLISDENGRALSAIADSEVGHLLSQSNSQFVQLEEELQKAISEKIYSAVNMLKIIADDLFQIAEQISNQIRQVSFDNLYEGVAMYSEPGTLAIKQYVHYSWYVSLVVTSAVILVSLCFLFGLFYGMCGRRPTYYNDDCCVRSTGGKFFSCGIWISVFLLTILTTLAVILMFIFGNVTHMVCNPMSDPLSRPDMISLAERYVAMYRKDDPTSEISKFLEKRTPADIVRSCLRNETFYQIFELDKRFHLEDLKLHENENYAQLTKYLELSLADLPLQHPIGSFVSKEELDTLHKMSKMNISQVSSEGLDKLKRIIHDLDITGRVNEFIDEVDAQHSGRPKAVTSILEQVKSLDAAYAKPLRDRLQGLHKNLTALDKRLQELQVPVASLVGKLEHAQALLSQGVDVHLKQAAKDVLKQLTDTYHQYLNHVKFQMENDVSSCAPVVEIARNARTALCGYTVDPINGAWMSLLICMVVTVPIIIMATTLVRLYNKMHPYPKYVVHEPAMEHQISSFITDTYDTRMKPGYPNYSYTDDYQRNYR